jgi:CRISPR system Cascade subunit CasA
MNLINDPWIPIRRKSGVNTLIAPWQLTETDDPVITLNAPRPDFNGALMQFLIGLLQTTSTPKHHHDWATWLEEPPTPEVLRARFAPYADAFALQGEKGSFMQDFEPLEGSLWSIERLVMEAPGENTSKLNKDHFFKRNQYKKMCLSCTAIALFSFQLNTQGFGASHRVSLRGKGAMTSLVVLDTESSLDLVDRLLWSSVWLNVLDENWLARLPEGKPVEYQSDLFPWMGRTRVSTSKKVKEGNKKVQVYIDGGVGTSPDVVSRFQVFWPMPCRIRLDLYEQECCCDLCGVTSESYSSGFKIQTFGVDYIGDWRNPMSPHRLDEQGVGRPIRVPTNGLQYQHWFGLVQKTDQQNPALVAERYSQLAESYGEQFRLFTFGYEIDGENKARCWYETTFPLLIVAEDIRSDFAKRVQILTEASAEFASFVRSCVKEAWFKRPGDAKGDVSFLTKSFYQRTETAFYQAVKDLQTKLVDHTDKTVLHAWHDTLRSAAFDLFDYWAAQGDIAQANPRRVADARAKLRNLCYSKKIKKMLQLPLNEERARKTRKPKKETA